MKRSSVFYWLLGIMIATVAIAAAFHFDIAVSDFIAHHRNRVVYNFMVNVSRFGDWPEHFAAGLILAGVAWWRGNKKWTRIFLSMLIALAIAGVVGRGIQIGTGRARPSVRTEEVSNRFSSKYNVREPARCCRLSAHPDLDWFLAHLYQGALFVRCCVRSDSRHSLRTACGPFFSSANPQSAARSRFAMRRFAGLGWAGLFARRRMPSEALAKEGHLASVLQIVARQLKIRFVA